MIRLSQSELARLGKKAQAQAKPPARGKRAPKAQPAAPGGAGRMARKVWDGPEVAVEIGFPPRPKERPRTFVDQGALVRAYTRSGGSVQRFVAIVKGQEREEGEGGIMRTVTPEDTKRYEEAVALVCSRAMAQAKAATYACPLEMEADFRFEGDPDTWPTAGGDGDFDNLLKAVLDGMEKGGVMTNDRIIVKSNVIKQCARAPGITVVVRPASPEPWAVRRG